MSKKGSIFALLLSGRAIESRRMRNKIATNEKQNRGGDVRASRPRVKTITTIIINNNNNTINNNNNDNQQYQQ